MRIRILSLDLKHLFDQNERFKVGRLDGEQKTAVLYFLFDRICIGNAERILMKSYSSGKKTL